MSGRGSRDKGNRTERALVRFLQSYGFAAERVPLSGSAGGSFSGDITIPILGLDRTAEVKVRGTGFRQLYSWLSGRDLLVVRADRRQPLVILPLRLAADIAAHAEQSKLTASAMKAGTAPSIDDANSNAMNRKGENRGK
jgi:Holliday junction resolvase